MRKIKLLSLLAALVCATSMWAADVAINGNMLHKFSVAADKQVYFSQGNLRATTSNNGSSWTWSFAENQYDYIGNAAANNAVSGNGTVSTDGSVDLFGWSTAATTYGIHNSASYSVYSGDFVDWGANAITNGGNEANVWRTLTIDEWNYLFVDRANAVTLFGLGSVNGVNGTILLPDDWTLPAGASFTASTTQGLVWKGGDHYDNTGGNNFSHNTYTAEQWSVMESAGAVFLPAAGYRPCTPGVYQVGVNGFYWSASLGNEAYAYYLDFNAGLLAPQTYQERAYSMSVRLVSETAPAITAYADPKKTGDNYSSFFHSTQSFVLPAGVEAYTAVVSGDKLNLTKIAEGGQVIPANTAVILKSNSSSITLTPSDEAGIDMSGIANSLQGVDAAIANPNYGRVYVLSAEDGDVGFYKLASGATIPAHKAYVTIAGSLSAPKRLRFVFDAATGVESIQNSDVRSQKVLRDGQLIIIRNGVEYNANGQIVK